MASRQQRACLNLNKSTLKLINNALDNDASVDLENVLQKVYTTYPSLRQKAENGKKKASPLHVSACPKRSICDAEWSLGPMTIQFPLSPHVQSMLLRTAPGDDLQMADISQCIEHLTKSGKRIWEGRERAIIQLADDIVVKVGQNLDYDEMAFLQFLEDNVPTIPAPRPLGFVVLGQTSFMFMSFIRGDTLEKRWPALNDEQKQAIKITLNDMLVSLRSVPFPSGSPLGSLSGLRVCKDLRVFLRTATKPSYTEADFNDFLLSSPDPRISPGYCAWLRSLLREDHRIVLTHGDFHPRNIMVVDEPGGNISISGIIDWEMGGFYPDYWELLKALNTRALTDTSDWWDYLPDAIIGYERDVAVDRLLESVVKWYVKLLLVHEILSHHRTSIPSGRRGFPSYHGTSTSSPRGPSHAPNSSSAISSRDRNPLTSTTFFSLPLIPGVL